MEPPLAVSLVFVKWIGVALFAAVALVGCGSNSSQAPGGSGPAPTMTDTSVVQSAASFRLAGVVVGPAVNLRCWNYVTGGDDVNVRDGAGEIIAIGSVNAQFSFQPRKHVFDVVEVPQSRIYTIEIVAASFEENFTFDELQGLDWQVELHLEEDICRD